MASTNTSSEIIVHAEPQRQPVTHDSDDNSSDEDWLRNPENELKQSLPSHGFKAVRCLPSENTYKKSIRQSLRGKSPRLGGSRTGSSATGGEVESVHSDTFNENEVFGGDFTCEEFSELVQRRKSLKEIPMTIHRKRTVRYSMTIKSCLHYMY